jgi:hypothetical protein
MVPLLVAGHLRELSTFLRRDDPMQIFIQPLLIFPILGTGCEHEYKRDEGRVGYVISER